jgi:nucleoside-diphosphate-sugar epimerase
MSERVLVTGAVGFIGGHACRALLQSQHEVVGLDNFDPFYDRRLSRGISVTSHLSPSCSTGWTSCCTWLRGPACGRR